MKTWVPALFQGWSDMQKNFWGQMGGMNFNMNQASSSSESKDKSETPANKRKR
ncbi:MAG: hypothetical protein JNN09_07610 [Alphaproteobacteria bacterium]|nr:hypothetical protein [Alphaproteobacteria bacterium]